MARVLLLMVPEHGRTSCSDENPQNYYTTVGRGGHPRCQRCCLLRTVADKQWPDGQTHAQINIEVKMGEI